MNTTRSNIISTLISAIGSIPAFAGADVFATSVPSFMEEPPGTLYVQVVPGSQTNEEGAEGWGKAVFNVSVCVFTQMVVDRQQDEVTALSNASNGLMSYIDMVDSAVLANTLGGSLAGPFVPEGIDAPESDGEEDGWYMQRRHYSCMYTFAYPGVT